LKLRSACDMFHKRQSDQETVDQYANRLRNSAKKTDMSEFTLLYAFVSGLKRKLAGFVLEKKHFFETAINKARLAEMSLRDQDARNSRFLLNQVSKMRKDMQKLAQRYDSMAITANAMSRKERSKSSRPKVTFQELPIEERDRQTGLNRMFKLRVSVTVPRMSQWL